MRIAAAADLQDYIDKEKVWRKKELINHKLMLRQARAHQKNMLLRAGVCLVYAHWEGFCKNAATAYLDYLGRRNIKLDALSHNLVAAALRGKIRECGLSKKPTLHTDLVAILRGSLATPARLSGTDLVDTESNLNSDVLRELTCLIGIDYSHFESKAVIIDEKLLKKRNSIAHGSYLDVDDEDYELLHTEVVAMIDELGDRIVNAVVLKKFMNGATH